MRTSLNFSSRQAEYRRRGRAGYFTELYGKSEKTLSARPPQPPIEFQMTKKTTGTGKKTTQQDLPKHEWKGKPRSRVIHCQSIRSEDDKSNRFGGERRRIFPISCACWRSSRGRSTTASGRTARWDIVHRHPRRKNHGFWTPIGSGATIGGRAQTILVRGTGEVLSLTILRSIKFRISLL